MILVKSNLVHHKNKEANLANFEPTGIQVTIHLNYKICAYIKLNTDITRVHVETLFAYLSVTLAGGDFNAKYLP